MCAKVGEYIWIKNDYLAKKKLSKLVSGKVEKLDKKKVQ